MARCLSMRQRLLARPEDGMSNRCYVTFWAVAVTALVLVARWLMRDYADYLLVADRLRCHIG